MRTLTLALLLSATLAVGAAEKFEAGSFSFEVPASFKVKPVPPGGMRKANLEFSTPDGKSPAEVVVFHFGAGQGGGVQANVDRWLGQFQEPREKINAKVEKKAAGKGQVTYVEAEGTYLSGMPGGPKTPMPGSKLLGAILESDGGNVFIRMTGPAAVVKAGDADFRKLIESALK